MGEMSKRTGAVLYGWEGGYSLDAVSIANWQGDVFFDHLRGTIDPNPNPRVDTEPFMLVCHWRDFDWTSQHETKFTPYADAASLIAAAAKLVEKERATGSYTVELWEVYGVRVTARS